MRKIGDKGSSAVLAVFLRNDLLKNVFLGRSSFCPSSHPTGLVGGWAAEQKPQGCLAGGSSAQEPDNSFVSLTPHKQAQPLFSSLTPPRPPPTPRHKRTLVLPSHFMLSAALVHLMPGNVWISCWLGTVTWGFFEKGSFIISLMGPAFSLLMKRQLPG